MRIGEVARRAGVTTTTIRYYESIGLLGAPVRTASGYRDYAQETIDRLDFVREAQASGLTLIEIASVLELKAAGASSCEHTRELLRRHLVELDERLERLAATRLRLAELVDRAEQLDPTECADAQRCQVIAAARQ